ncbi:MAG: NUDIX hydrolase [Synergistetes bacterium]|nr:NUDIX hydrolase [Synergistota bacterium]MCX8128224.1 NUDIX hydrolase [Synergistota bacterium]MDW8192671.1 NUDIX hydrolase [Synergistota bacterium]
MEKALNKKILYKGKILNLRVDEVIFDDDRTATREIIEHNEAIVVVPVLDDKKIVMVKQYRYAVGEELLELPAGTLEKGETPIECAKRELLEETGYRAQKVEELTSFYSSPGFCTEKIYLFLATGLEKKEQKLDSDERIKVEIHSVEDLKEKIKTGNLRDAKSVAGILYYILFCSNERTS